ncbi:MAG: relaxase/mobilization nuclease domain-containing protein [Gordonibacter sp.]|uniref:relaxase/mobilization nuclease domain-containing protein n=1 Tax=Gordonibacter sp. TaxID=1968902 RepID=UPI002B3ED9E9|nr:relaxase/mobilization nuclease domain-containing protein [Gordonibacter sp.]
MPVVKPISGHTSCKGIRDYLNKEGRALACDLFNLSWDEREMDSYDDSEKSCIDWAAEMDLTRAAYGNDTPYRGKCARTYKHYVLSPDPGDKVNLARMREFAKTWALENFADYEVAITYHDDNAKEIMHAHIVVNNTNLATGNRLQDPDPRALKRSAQRLAEERGMSFFVDEPPAEETPSFGGNHAPAKRERVHYRRAERELEAQGKYSWVADIRSRVGIAMRLAQSDNEFAKILSELGIERREASERNGKADWLYALEGHETWCIRGEGLGTAYGKAAVESALRSPSPMQPELVRQLAENAVEVGGWRDLKQLAGALDVTTRWHVRSMGDFERKIASAHARGDEESVVRLAAAEAYLTEKGIEPKAALPASRAVRQPAPDTTGQDRRNNFSNNASMSEEQRREHQRDDRGKDR